MKKVVGFTVVIVVFYYGVVSVAPATAPVAQLAAPAGSASIAPAAVVVAGAFVLSADSPLPCTQGGICMPSPTPTTQRIAVVIDDDPSWQMILRFNLQRVGFQVQTCPSFCDNPQATVFFVDGQDPSDVFVGPEMVRQFRQNHPSAVIIGFTGRPDALDANNQRLDALFLAAGANLVLDKGVSWESWVPELRPLLGLP